MKRLKTLLIVGFAVVVLAAAAVTTSGREELGRAAQGGGSAEGPWQVGKCYRVFPANRDTLYTFRVLQAPVGPWVRVETVPTSPEVPGSKPAASRWLNSESAFLVQDWSCPE